MTAHLNIYFDNAARDVRWCKKTIFRFFSPKRELDVKTKETISLKKTAKQLLEKAKLTTGTEDLSLPLSLKEVISFSFKLLSL